MKKGNTFTCKDYDKADKQRINKERDMVKKVIGKPFEKGQSGNPKGRPKKGTALSDILRERVDAVKLADALLKNAYTGDVAALKAVYDRVDGRARESIELNTDNELNAKLTAILGSRK